MFDRGSTTDGERFRACQKFYVRGITFHERSFHASYLKPRISRQTTSNGKAALPQLSAKMLEELIPCQVTKEQFQGNFDNFKKAFIERALNAEMSHYLGYGPGKTKPEGYANHRNGSSAKTVITDSGSVRLCIEVPREGTHNNANSQPFRWTATADSILEKLHRLCTRISGTGH